MQPLFNISYRRMKSPYGDGFAFRAYCNGEWVGTIWRHVLGFSWARVRINGDDGGHYGDECASIEAGKRSLERALRAEKLGFVVLRETV